MPGAKLFQNLLVPSLRLGTHLLEAPLRLMNASVRVNAPITRQEAEPLDFGSQAQPGNQNKWAEPGNQNTRVRRLLLIEVSNALFSYPFASSDYWAF